MKLIKVVCGIIWNDKKVFIARRKPGKSLAGFWEFPGGKIEANENPETALIRELEEELGMIVKIHRHFGNIIHHYDGSSIELMAFECNYISASFHLTDHDEIAFVYPIELSDYLIAPADLFFAKKLTD